MNDFQNENEILRYLREVNAEETAFQLFIVSATPSGSGSSSSGGGGGISASTSGLFEDVKHFSLADWAGGFSGTRNLKIEDIEASLKAFFDNLDYSLGADNWMQLCKTIVEASSYPDILNEYVIKSEQKLYDSPTSTKLKDAYQANLIYQLFFNLVRFHVHANVEEFDISKAIIDDLYDNWTDVDSQYQYPIVYYKFVEAISTGKFQEATDAMKRLHAILKMTDDAKRHAIGLWDDWTCVLIIVWYASTLSASFEKHLMNDLKITDSFYHMKRKSSIIKNLKESGMEELLTTPYFRKMKETYSVSNIEKQAP